MRNTRNSAVDHPFLYQTAAINADGFLAHPASENQIRSLCRSIGREGLPYLLLVALGNNEKRESFPAKGNSPYSAPVLAFSLPFAKFFRPLSIFAERLVPLLH